MKQSKRVLAFDFGASSGRAVLGFYDGETIRLEEVHRFSNDPVEVCGTLYWDTLRQFYEIKQGLVKAQLAGGFESVGIDTWGVDFGLLDEDGRLLENAVHYRDTRTKSIIEQSFQRLPRERFYRITGNQFMELNTVFQLYALTKQRPKLKMTLIIRDIMLGNPKLDEIGWHEEALGRNAILGGFQGQRMWTDWLPNCDFAEAILNTTFDWNGKKEPQILAIENDGLNGTAMLLGKLLTGTASVFADVRTYWSPEAVERVTGKKPTGKAANGFIHLINSGAAALDGCGLAKDMNGKGCMKRWWNMEESDIQAILDATDWPNANLEYFRGGGFSSHFRTQSEMPVTMVRVNIIAGVGPTLQIAEGYTVTLDEDVHKILDDRTDKIWPTTWFAPRLDAKGFESVYDVMAKWGANHGAFSYGHIGKDLITLASMLRIPVSLHNIEDCDLYRPHSWNAFGTKELESADYRACAAYGALYK